MPPALFANDNMLPRLDDTMIDIAFDLRGQSTLSNCVIDAKPGEEGAAGAPVAELMKLGPEAERP